ncbi:metal ABC transporter substrate-binding protein [Salinisphaera sp. USBA-960]|nr:metal ABC transporter substrate-binding protein [Salifodinibacter halophilus]NNC25875.1 metal ABC transporter substrate-binding protein [Salifodinibacter halophilus]
MKRSTSSILAALTAGVMGLTGPAMASKSDDSKGDQLKGVTTFTIIKDMAQNVAGDDAEVVSIVKPGAEVHDYQPTPQDIAGANDADIILRNGFKLGRWFDQFLANLSDVPAVKVNKGIKPIMIGSGEYEGYPNPHAWMGPKDAVKYVDNIRDVMVKYDPDHADGYRKRAKAYKKEIRDTVKPMKKRIHSIDEDKRWLVSCEGAFDYLARSLGMQTLFLWPVNAEQVGTPQQVRKVIDGVKKHNIPAVFCESTVNNKAAKQVARDTGARYGGRLYVDSLSQPGGPVPTYLDLLRVDTKRIADALTSKKSKDKDN